MDTDPLTRRIIGCGIEVHQAIGPGLLESAYLQSLAHELHLAGLEFTMEHPLPVIYKNVRLDCGYRIDLLVENQVVVELKSIEKIKPIHHAQILTYMKLAGMPTGLLINFNVTKLTHGIKRFKL
ncbi:MAG: GxxExxY protein [Desulfobacteraceae bacterium]|nr:GxxExxY protein [Desulfobacteraceae bacterium]